MPAATLKKILTFCETNRRLAIVGSMLSQQQFPYWNPTILGKSGNCWKICPSFPRWCRLKSLIGPIFVAGRANYCYFLKFISGKSHAVFWSFICVDVTWLLCNQATFVSYVITIENIQIYIFLKIDCLKISRSISYFWFLRVNGKKMY